MNSLAFFRWFVEVKQMLQIMVTPEVLVFFGLNCLLESHACCTHLKVLSSGASAVVSCSGGQSLLSEITSILSIVITTVVMPLSSSLQYWFWLGVDPFKTCSFWTWLQPIQTWVAHLSNLNDTAIDILACYM